MIMNRIKNILVALDLSKLDDVLIEYASFIAERLKAEKVFFVHNIKKYEISELFQENLKDLNLDEIIGDELNEKVEEKFKSGAKWEVLISEDPYSESLLKYVADKYAVQLAIVGNKNHVKGTGVVSSKLLRLLRCDILSVPQNVKHQIATVWAGIDFSQDSRKIFRAANELQESSPIDIKAVHIYSVPVQFSPYLSKESMKPKIEKHVWEKSEKFIKKLDYPGTIEPLVIHGRESAIAETLSEQVNKSGADLLMVADKGGNTFSPFAVGSVTEDLFSKKLDVPLWIAKKL